MSFHCKVIISYILVLEYPIIKITSSEAGSIIVMGDAFNILDMLLEANIVLNAVI